MDEQTRNQSTRRRVTVKATCTVAIRGREDSLPPILHGLLTLMLAVAFLDLRASPILAPRNNEIGGQVGGWFRQRASRQIRPKVLRQRLGVASERMEPSPQPTGGGIHSTQWRIIASRP
jgi:hypothetical protein